MKTHDKVEGIDHDDEEKNGRKGLSRSDSLYRPQTRC